MQVGQQLNVSGTLVKSVRSCRRFNKAHKKVHEEPVLMLEAAAT